MNETVTAVTLSVEEVAHQIARLVKMWDDSADVLAEEALVAHQDARPQDAAYTAQHVKRLKDQAYAVWVLGANLGIEREVDNTLGALR